MFIVGFKLETVSCWKSNQSEAVLRKYGHDKDKGGQRPSKEKYAEKSDVKMFYHGFLHTSVFLWWPSIVTSVALQFYRLTFVLTLTCHLIYRRARHTAQDFGIHLLLFLFVYTLVVHHRGKYGGDHAENADRSQHGQELGHERHADRGRRQQMHGFCHEDHHRQQHGDGVPHLLTRLHRQHEHQDVQKRQRDGRTQEVQHEEGWQSLEGHVQIEGVFDHAEDVPCLFVDRMLDQLPLAVKLQGWRLDGVCVVYRQGNLWGGVAVGEDGEGAGVHVVGEVGHVQLAVGVEDHRGWPLDLTWVGDGDGDGSDQVDEAGGVICQGVDLSEWRDPDVVCVESDVCDGTGGGNRCYKST